MARIRSVHPGIFTDEEFMSVSIEARMLLIGIWTEAFDDGVFEWKPLTLKARIFPVNDVDVAARLDELVEAGIIARFSAGQKPYGAVRNFQKFQRPKKPNSSGVLPDGLREYVGSSALSPEPVPNQFPTGGEKSPQMEDGGWNRRGREEEKGEDARAAAQPAPPAKPARGSALPDDWEPKPQHFEIASGHGLGPGWVEDKAQEMRDWAVANRNRAVARKADWDRTFSGWLRRDAGKAASRNPQILPFAQHQGPRHGNRIIDALDRIGARLEGYDAGIPPSGRSFAN